MIPSKLKLLISSLLALLAGTGIYFSQQTKVASDCYKITYFYDGDTIKLDIGGKEEKIRLLGIDTPEMNFDSSKKPDCYAQEATDKIKKIINNSCVKIKRDSLAGDKDKYGRLLRYIYLPDNTFVNLEMVKQGYAFNYIYSDNEFKKEFTQAEEQAKGQRLGLWGKNCNYFK